MICLDSSIWIEYFFRSELAKEYVSIIQGEEALIVSSLTIFEVYKKVLSESDTPKALDALALIRYRSQIISVSEEIAIEAVVLSKHYKLAMADSVILTTAVLHNATLWTQDKHFKDIEGVKYFAKP